MCASGSLFSIRPGTLGATIQGVFMRNFILTFISHFQRVAASWRGAINSILFINAVCEARPGTRAEAGTMSSLENYKWVYLAFQRRLRVTRISRYGYRGIFIVMSSRGPAPQLNSALVQAGAPLSSLLSWFIKIPGLGWEVRQPSGHSVLGRNKEIWISNFGITNFTVMHLHNVLK